jgi:MFS family permease
VVVLFAAFILSFIARLIVSLLVPSLKLPPEQGGLGLSDADIGVLQGPGFVLFYAVVGILIGRLADRYSRRGIIATGIAGWSLMTVACGLARDFNQLLGARVGVGIGQSALSPAAYSMIADLFPRDRLGRALGVYQAGGLVGTGLAFLVGGLVIRAVSTSAGITLPVVGTVAGWQFAFIAVGLPGFLVALLLATVPEPLRRSAGAAAGGSGAVLAYLGSRLRVYGLHYAGFALLAMPYTIIAAWSPVLFQRVHGYTPPEAGLALGAILAVASPLGVLTGGFLADRLQQRGARDAARHGARAAAGEPGGDARHRRGHGAAAVRAVRVLREPVARHAAGGAAGGDAGPAAGPGVGHLAAGAEPGHRARRRPRRRPAEPVPVRRRRRHRQVDGAPLRRQPAARSARAGCLPRPVPRSGRPGRLRQSAAPRCPTAARC